MQVKEGRVAKCGVLASGVSHAGNQWRRQDYVIEFHEFETDQWSQKITISLMGDNIERFSLRENDIVSFRFTCQVREFQGRFYPEFRIVPDSFEKKPVNEPAVAPLTNAPKVDASEPSPNVKVDNLPFD